MKKFTFASISLIVVFGAAFLIFQMDSGVADTTEKPDWSLNATAIEACSCPMFCQCYFNTEPAGHSHGHGHDHTVDGEIVHFCKFNMAFKVNKGHHGDTRLDDAKFWIAGDLGSGWEDGTMDWAVVHFDPSVTNAQREGIIEVFGPLFPVTWKSFDVKDDKKIDWEAGKDKSVAKLDDGKAAEIQLKRPFSAMSQDHVVLTNVQYWGAPRNDGFILMPNEVQAYRTGDKKFEYNGTNGFMITIDINSDDI
ncbi:MAG: DUF1326 domain-containing protein [Balneolaceae bacterium]